MNYYSCYNLRIESSLELPEMASQISKPQSVDVSIHPGEVNISKLLPEQQVGPFLWINETTVYLHIIGVAWFEVSNGDHIRFQVENDCDEDSIRVFLLGSAMGALLFQRGLLVLHGNAIQIGKSAIICAGHSGAGKSTLAAAFMKRGYSLLSDDVVPIDDQYRAIPGFPRIKLWKDAADQLGIDTTTLRRIRPDMEKFNFPIPDNHSEQPIPVSHVYLLNSDTDSGFTSTPVTGMNRFKPLYRNTYRVNFLENMAMKPEHLKLCGGLASRIQLTRITRPREGFAIDGLVDHILNDVHGKPNSFGIE